MSSSLSHLKPLEALRQWLKENQLDAFIVPIADPHRSEFVCEHYLSLHWLSGFTGSAGTLVVTLDNAIFWTDSRYHIQAEQELPLKEIELIKKNAPSLEDIISWLSQNMKAGSKIGIDGNLFTYTEVQKLTFAPSLKKLLFNTQFDPFETLWSNRPPLSSEPFFLFGEKYAGETSESKLQRLRTSLKEKGVDGMLISNLFEIAWLLNLRGKDVECNPVGTAYLYLTHTEGFFFASNKKVPQKVSSYLHSLNISLKPYEAVFDFLQHIPEKHLFCDQENTSFKLVNSFPKECKVLSTTSPIALFKAVKNATEIAGTKNAMVKDGIALVKCLMWLEKAIATSTLTEYDLSLKLLEIKKEIEGFVEESFATIAGYGPNGAIGHYRPTREKSSILRPESFLVLDCGSQYLDGTTDITRTLALGPISEQQRREYTLVLKGHIAIALLHFPEGTDGREINAFAHSNLWKEGLDYFHGTGHGVGHFLGVHEGPQRISKNVFRSIPLQKGMIISDEPGLYYENKYGIRIENLVTVIPSQTTEFGNFLKFETLTLFPYEQKAIVKEMLNKEEIDFINEYHARVYQTLSPYLNKEEKDWLKTKTQEI